MNKNTAKTMKNPENTGFVPLKNNQFILKFLLI